MNCRIQLSFQDMDSFIPALITDIPFPFLFLDTNMFTVPREGLMGRLSFLKQGST